MTVFLPAHECVSVLPAVADALAARQPVVALESTIIAHGMPFPRNLETARAVEAAVRTGGAVPATIAVLDGRIRVGLTEDDLEQLATGAQIGKLSRRDLPIALATGADGATTVAATMICARLAGIQIFATGGIGGVHRGGDSTLDISADLEELARSSVAVVCAGAKAILDLPKTLEYLETHGVPVLGYQTEAFPAFYSRDSGLPVLHRCDTPEAVARILRVKWQMGMEGGVVIANPIPEAAALDGNALDGVIAMALADAQHAHISGKALTPFLLARLEDLTEGRSLEANIALMLSNAAVAAAIAMDYARFLRETALPPRMPQGRQRYF